MEDLQRFKHKEIFAQDFDVFPCLKQEVKLLVRPGPSPPVEGNFQQNCSDDDDDIAAGDTVKLNTRFLVHEGSTHHEGPRLKLYGPDDETFSNSLKKCGCDEANAHKYGTEANDVSLSEDGRGPRESRSNVQDFQPG